ncbi:MAG TPA: hypothetical protein VKU88_01325 [Acidimicrobiales bacterium]|nr:hypothetical protein [Acidimicrobiales bacterium]
MTKLSSASRVLASAVLMAATLAAAVVVAAVAPAPRAAAQTSQASSPGYWIVGSDGGVYQFGTTNFGGMQGVQLNAPIVGGAPTSDGLGYWMVGSDGGIFTFGDAHFYGSTGNIHLWKPIVGMAADPATGGYWLVASDGGVFSFNAPFYGSMGGIKLNQPVVGMAATPDGGGYWLVAADGGIFSFGDARFYGSTGNLNLVKPVVGMAATPDGGGYWLVASDGGIFSFGDATFYGSAADLQLDYPIVSMSSTPSGHGYWLVGSDGGVFTYGDAPFLGTPAASGKNVSAVAMLATADGYPFPPGGTGYDVSQFQCPQNGGSIPTTQTQVAIVQVSGGAINSSPNPCYAQEAAWAGSNMSAYIFLDELPSPAPPESLSGPAGTCNGNVDCESYNFGYYWAAKWVSYSRGLGIDPTLWWLDVEGPTTWWANQPPDSNSAVISGAVAGLRASSVLAGIYSTNLQWGEITGYQVNFPGIALWIPGAGQVSQAPSFCSLPAYDGPAPAPSADYYSPFADGQTVLVQYGYYSGYQGDDPDYACQ